MKQALAAKFVLLTIGAGTMAAAAACNPIPPSTPLVDGPSVAAPAGWVDYCRRHDEDPGCPR